MWKLLSGLLGIFVGSIAGMLLGDRWAREDLAERWSVMNQIAEQSQGVAERRMAAQLLAVAKLLRENDADRAFEVVETAIERSRAAIAADQGTSRASELDESILNSIKEYQVTYPWSPPTPGPEESEFFARFGRFGPFIQDGKVVGFRVSGVQPDSVFAQIGIASGDLITRYDGRPVSMDRSPSLAEALQSGSRVDLTVRAPDGTIRQVQVPQR